MRSLKFAAWIALVFMLIEIVGGIVAHSLALISDALHMFSDVGALTLGWLMAWIALRPANSRFSYGFHRAEILGALASALALWALCIVLVYQAILRLIQPEEVQGGVVFIIAAFGLGANLLMMRLLHDSRNHSLNMKAAYLHVIGDLLGSVGVLLAGALIWLTGWNPIDPIITILFAFGILFGSGKVIRDSVKILMESTPSDTDLDAVKKSLESLPHVTEVHDLHIWSVSSHKKALSVHLVAGNTQETLKQAHQLIEKIYHIQHMTIQIEDKQHFDSRYCYDCHPQKLT